MGAADIERRKLLLAGDAEGNLEKLFQQIDNQQRRVGKFDMLLNVGAFLPGTGEGSAKAAAALAEYVSGKKKAPIETYFIESRSAAMLQAAPEGKMLCENVHFLGGFGIRDINGLRVAYLSGRYDPAVYKDAGASAPAFVGAAYTPQAVEGLKNLARKPGAPSIDLFLTAEWPSRIEEKLDEVEKPQHPEGLPFNWQEVSCSPVVAELCLALEPRYHVFAHADIFYQRPPFQTPDRGFVCRCIALGKVGSKGKGRTWVHGLSLSPAASMPQAALLQRPENTTPCPFIIAAANDDQADTASLKRGASEMMETVVEEKPCEVFLSRLPPNIDEKRLHAALKHCGKIENIRIARDEAADDKPCKGFGWVTFEKPEEAEAACELSDLLECAKRKIQIQLSRPKARPDGGQPKKKREVQIVIEPHAECWFCLVNPKVEKHMIVTATTEVYVATARGPINPMHVMVLPVKHAPCFAACPPELQDVLQAHVQAIRKMCHASNQECIVWERWIPMGTSAANHMQIQLLPIEMSRAANAREALEAATKRHMDGAKLKRISAHSEVLHHLNDDASTPYIYLEMPGDNTAKGRQVERFVYAGFSKAGGPRIPLNFGRQVACQLLNCDEKVDWRQCQEDRDCEKELAVKFRAKYKQFQPK